ncbi:MAG: glycoside hydrolase family 15 protein [Actinomycetota bacterium]|jgi:GH15 family glucan-1,4-alpha-glucosidase|nr:glycoside hydrolase family 15 protein [Actinomycetota bacterium]
MAKIEDYAIVGDTQTVALVGLDGSMDWLCLPRFDSPACFAKLLGDDDNGHWRISPADGRSCTSRRYHDDTLVLETQWETDQGTVRVIDFMPPRDQTPDIVRIVEGVSGRVQMSSRLKLRFDYGQLVPWVRRLEGQLAAVAGPDSVYLRSDVEHHGEGFATVADFTVSEGDRVHFVLTWHPSHEEPPTPVDPDRALMSTVSFWEQWSTGCAQHGKYTEAVTRSLLTLKALTYSPTGGIVAAATTSLPEEIGGVRNWDYRYCWLRDATFTLEALLHAGFTAEAESWTQWLLRAIAGSPQDLQIMYGVAGERRLTEYNADWLAGYQGSTPVRIGNAAAEQLQLDVFGEVLGALAVARTVGVPSTDASWDVQRALVDHLGKIWREPDEGLWEVRGARQHFTHSKVMAWVAFDRVAKAVEELGFPGPAQQWREQADEIHDEVCARAYDEQRGAFVQAYGSKRLDAAVLLIPRVGFLPGDDPRMVRTVETIQRELANDGFVHRYETGPESGGTNVDGLPGGEGAFLACSFWLADALHMAGRQDEAREQFERLLAVRNDVGLLAEEYDPVAGRQLGNYPQAFSHIGLVNTAHLLTQGDGVAPRGGREDRPEPERD